MLSDKIFVNALIISIIFHIFFFSNWPHFKRAQPHKKIKLTYYSQKSVPVTSEFISEKEKKGDLPVKKPRKTDITESGKKDLATRKFRTKGREELPVKPKGLTASETAKDMASERSMLISYKDKDFSSEPIYLNYYNAVRGRIYKAANANKPYYFMEGEVRIVFVLSRDGRLQHVAVIKEGSTNNPILQNHALTSIKRAAPFPAFDPTMKEAQLTLRIAISFEK